MFKGSIAEISEAAGRFFRSYRRHCIQPDPDTLFGTLTAMHSLNDRLKHGVGQDFHQFEEFVALKALRNLTHHVEEVRANVRVIPAHGASDIAMMCIVRGDQVGRAIEGTEKKWRETTRTACAHKFHWYGPAVNINPCIFNFAVHAYEMLKKLQVLPPKDALEEFEASYLFEVENGHAHFIDGRITSRASEVSAILSSVVAGMPKP